MTHDPFDPASANHGAFDPDRDVFGRDWQLFWIGYLLGLVCSPLVYWLAWQGIIAIWGLA